MRKITKQFFSVLMGITVLMVGIVVIGCLVGVEEPAPEPVPVAAAKPAYYTPSHGDVVKITQTIIGATKEDLARALDLFGAGDQMGLVRMIEDGRAAVTDPVTVVRVIDMTASLREVRILDGDLEGLSGWIVAEAVKEKVN